MKVIRADILGFCMGVKRAVEKADTAINTYTKKRIYSLGPLIHNPLVLKDFASRGLSIIDENAVTYISPGDIVIIRAHGVPKNTEEQLQKQGAVIIDATCPRVAASQRRAAHYSQKKVTVILAGDKGHGEVESIAGYAGDKFVLLESYKNAVHYIASSQDLPAQAVLLSQTTFNLDEFERIAALLKKKISCLDIFNTICPATRKRQAALEKLCGKVDGVLVIGGKNSANTQRLYEKAKKLCTTAALIEDSSEIPSGFYRLETVGLTAGASTPDFIINEVNRKLLNR